MFELTPTQRQQVREANGEAVRVIDPDTKQEYVLMPAGNYERLKSLLYDDNEWSPEDRLQLLAESGKRAGWDAPEMDAYDNYDESRRKPCQ